MARSKYKSDKRQKELARQKKKAEKRQRKLDRKTDDGETASGAPPEEAEPS
jgi:hypothetical protein